MSSTLPISKETSPQPRKKRIEQWSDEDKSLFYSSLCDFGKDFDALREFLSNKPVCADNGGWKSKEQIQRFFYRTAKKLCTELGMTTFADGHERAQKELELVICFGLLRRKIPEARILREKSRLRELVTNGCCSVVVKGKRWNIRNPKHAMRSNMFNKLVETSPAGKTHLEVTTLDVELLPSNDASWEIMQTASFNPRLLVTVHADSTLDCISELLNNKAQGHALAESLVLSTSDAGEGQSGRNWTVSEAADQSLLRLYLELERPNVIKLQYGWNDTDCYAPSNALRRLLQVAEAEYVESNVAAVSQKSVAVQTAPLTTVFKTPPPVQQKINPQTVNQGRCSLNVISSVGQPSANLHDKEVADALVAQLRAQRPAGMRTNNRQRMRRPMVVQRNLLPKNTATTSTYTLVTVGAQLAVNPSQPIVKANPNCIIQSAMAASNIIPAEQLKAELPVTSSAAALSSVSKVEPVSSVAVTSSVPTAELQKRPEIELMDISLSGFERDNSLLDLRDLAPSPLKRNGSQPEPWNGGDDFSLSQYLAPSPVKAPPNLALNENSRDSLASRGYDVDSELLAVMNEDSMQSYNKFADLAGMVASEGDKHRK